MPRNLAQSKFLRYSLVPILPARASSKEYAYPPPILCFFPTRLKQNLSTILSFHSRQKWSLTVQKFTAVTEDTTDCEISKIRKQPAHCWTQLHGTLAALVKNAC